jgi:hypothetical protein
MVRVTAIAPKSIARITERRSLLLMDDEAVPAHGGPTCRPAVPPKDHGQSRTGTQTIVVEGLPARPAGSARATTKARVSQNARANRGSAHPLRAARGAATSSSTPPHWMLRYGQNDGPPVVDWRTPRAERPCRFGGMAPSRQGWAAPRLGTTTSRYVTGRRARWGAQSRR